MANAGALALAMCVFASEVIAQSQALGTAWTYTLLGSSQLLDTCPVCDRPDIPAPMQGTFQLRLIQQHPLFSTYAMENLSFVAVSLGGSVYRVTGEGTYQIGGEVAMVQNLWLKASIDNGFTNIVCYFTNMPGSVTRLWPMIEISLAQTNGSMVKEYYLNLEAAPFREIWMSTTQSFHAGVWAAPTNSVSAGDLISSTGNILRRNSDLTSKLGIMPPVPDLGLKDVDILPGGEVAFSIGLGAFSETLGSLEPGDLLSDQGRVLASHADLLSAFAPQAAVPDVGLNAVQVLDSGEIYFSVQTNFFSEALGRTIRPGDLLSNRGAIIRSNETFVARFGPSDPKQDYGIQTIYLWPSGEIWFSILTNLNTTNSISYSPGDLLSDQGYLVYRNVDLLSAFAPLEKTTHLGLDALYVVTDVTPSPRPPLCLAVNVGPNGSDLSLQFEGHGRAFQLERAAGLPGPWLPASPVGLDLSFTDSSVLRVQPQAFYRLREW